MYRKTLFVAAAFSIAAAFMLSCSPTEQDLSGTAAVNNAEEEAATESRRSSVALNKDYLNPGEALNRGDSIRSNDGRYRFIMQDDGNLVLYNPWRALWATGTNGRAVARCIMQSDGNLVLYGYDNRPVWASNTAGHAGARLIVQSDGNVVIYQASQAIWATNTYEH